MNLIDWQKCEKEFIRKVEIDKERINSIIEMSLQRLSVIQHIKENTNTISFIVEGYYEAIKELLVAYLLKNGLRSKNHQCLITFFYRKNPDYEFEANVISQMSFFRNRLDYYGEKIPETFFQQNKQNFDKIINILQGLLK